METLTPAQRIATIAIGLVLTAIVAIWVLPWAGDKIAAWLPPTRTPVPVTPTLATASSGQLTQTPARTPTPTPTLALTPPPSAVLLEPVPYPSQAPDSCNLAPLGIVLSHWGYTDTHEIVAPIVCPGELDSSVEAEELSAYAESRGLEAHVAVNGDIETLQQLLANGFPIVVTRWMTTTDSAGARRYQAVRGYDQVAQAFTVHDFLAGSDVALSYADMDRGWHAFSRQYILIYPPQDQDRVKAILGDDWIEREMWENALRRAEEELEAGAQGAGARQAFSWMNVGSAWVALAEYERAWEAFDSAQEVGLSPHLLWYRFAPYRCLLALEDYERLLSLTQTAIDEGATVEEIHFYRAQAYVALNDVAQVRVEYERALEIHPGWKPAIDGLNALSG